MKNMRCRCHCFCWCFRRRRRGRSCSIREVRVGERQRAARRDLELALGAVAAAAARSLEGGDEGPQVQDVFDGGLEEARCVEFLAVGRGDEVAEAVEPLLFVFCTWMVEVEKKGRKKNGDAAKSKGTPR